jgi:hypothetical protein
MVKIFVHRKGYIWRNLFLAFFVASFKFRTYKKRWEVNPSGNNVKLINRLIWYVINGQERDYVTAYLFNSTRIEALLFIFWR